MTASRLWLQGDNDVHSRSTNLWRRARRGLGAIVRILRTLRVLGASDEPLLPPIVSGAFKRFYELRIGFLCIFFFLLSFPVSFLLLFFSFRFALSALCILTELMLVNFLLLWFSALVVIECTSE